MTDKVGKSSLDKKLTRRKAVKTIAGGITALAAYHSFPASWEKPIVESIFIPAHAQTSGTLPPIVDGPDEPTTPVTPPGPIEPPPSFDGQYSGNITMIENSGDTPFTFQASVTAEYSAPNASVTVKAGGLSFCTYVGNGPANQVINLSNTDSSGNLNCPRSGQFSVISANGSAVQVGISIAQTTGEGTLIKIQ